MAFHNPAGFGRPTNGGPEVRLARKLLANWVRLHSGGTCHLCDPLALVAAIQPKLLICRVTPSTVEMYEDRRRDGTRFGGADPAVCITTGVDVEVFFSLLVVCLMVWRSLPYTVLTPRYL